mmetsp:Transcript_8640/g.24371  ORF Transcript_8640/g.24371 Transcript_8640/m.24371 type:complete len:203 (+) Transcript_8640:592-1200(+)
MGLGLRACISAAGPSSLASSASSPSSGSSPSSTSSSSASSASGPAPGSSASAGFSAASLGFVAASAAGSPTASSRGVISPSFPGAFTAASGSPAPCCCSSGSAAPLPSGVSIAEASAAGSSSGALASVAGAALFTGTKGLRCGLTAFFTCPSVWLGSASFSSETASPPFLGDACAMGSAGCAGLAACCSEPCPRVSSAASSP